MALKPRAHRSGPANSDISGEVLADQASVGCELNIKGPRPASTKDIDEALDRIGLVLLLAAQNPSGPAYEALLADSHLISWSAYLMGAPLLSGIASTMKNYLGTLRLERAWDADTLRLMHQDVLCA